MFETFEPVYCVLSCVAGMLLVTLVVLATIISGRNTESAFWQARAAAGDDLPPGIAE